MNPSGADPELMPAVMPAIGLFLLNPLAELFWRIAGNVKDAPRRTVVSIHLVIVLACHRTIRKPFRIDSCLKTDPNQLKIIVGRHVLAEKTAFLLAVR